MAEQSTHTIERIARVLAGERLSANAEGADPSAGSAVNQRWHEYREQAVAVLKSLRDPPPEIDAAADREAWSRGIAAALGEHTGTGGGLGQVAESVEHFFRAPS